MRGRQFTPILHNDSVEFHDLRGNLRFLVLVFVARGPEMVDFLLLGKFWLEDLEESITDDG